MPVTAETVRMPKSNKKYDKPVLGSYVATITDVVTSSMAAWNQELQTYDKNDMRPSYKIRCQFEDATGKTHTLPFETKRYSSAKALERSGLWKVIKSLRPEVHIESLEDANYQAEVMNSLINRSVMIGLEESKSGFVAVKTLTAAPHGIVRVAKIDTSKPQASAGPVKQPVQDASADDDDIPF